jgi:hypothetical protein
MSTPVLEIQWIRDRLSQWTAWHYRSGIADNGNPGVYVLAHFSEAPQSVDPICAEVVYVGEAHKAGRSLCDRWWEFDRSAFGKAYDNHAGGNTYRDEFGASQRLSLYVSALPIALAEPWYPAFILAAERLLVWQYALRHRRLPRCNRE